MPPGRYRISHISLTTYLPHISRGAVCILLSHPSHLTLVALSPSPLVSLWQPQLHHVHLRHRCGLHGRPRADGLRLAAGLRRRQPREAAAGGWWGRHPPSSSSPPHHLHACFCVSVFPVFTWFCFILSSAYPSLLASSPRLPCALCYTPLCLILQGQQVLSNACGAAAPRNNTVTFVAACGAPAPANPAVIYASQVLVCASHVLMSAPFPRLLLTCSPPLLRTHTLTLPTSTSTSTALCAYTATCRRCPVPR